MSPENIRRSLAFLAIVALLGLYVNSASSKTVEAPLLKQTEVAHYPKWARVNPKPVIFHAAPAEQCAPASLGQLPNLHRDKYITVYVNKVGRQAMLTQEKPVFPQGSVLVKEKRATLVAAPELLTIMIKREKGFNPENGDWEYAVLNGQATQVQAQGKLANCQQCHQAQKSLDYTFRDAYFTYHPERHSIHHHKKAPKV